MKTISVDLGERSYRIVIGRGLLQQSGKIVRRLGIGNAAFVITNSLVKRKYGSYIEKAFKAAGFSLRYKLVADSETSKSLLFSVSSFAR